MPKTTNLSLLQETPAGPPLPENVRHKNKMKAFRLTRISARGEFNLGIRKGESARAIFAKNGRISPLKIISENGKVTVAETPQGHAHLYLTEL